jgi:hypothetical protein
VCHHQTKQQDLFSESLSMFFPRELHRCGYCLLGSLIENLFKVTFILTPVTISQNFALLRLALFLFSIRRRDLTISYFSYAPD